MLGLQLSVYLTLSTRSLAYLLSKYLWRAYYAPDTVLGLKEVTFSGEEGEIQNTLGICPVAMTEVTWTEKGREHPLCSLEMESVRAFQERWCRTASWGGKLDLIRWDCGKRGKDGIPDREHGMWEGRAMGESIGISVMQLVHYGIESSGWSLTLECLVLPFSGPVIGKLLDHPGL